ncbi:2-succinyl-5-enolpyruvyl-6-hydroxy-3-cyclohexene-1-carboxylic-acid synthase [Desulfallas thermosapovorans]|uniref:2-succinyl-5-enolpyruvyl-6-hydroxy-3-cyclohexene-1-carboxylate synthase n=1 Tax=Desulfallas thermosapovorans DSM 6562 TaxID=1121431 RepID=A0A5S4ZP81_9FIRM|nr:2-succinyl-5-enolpyruvyl-6-hydroxy-3-cyclohexene-1-carboxylic-acid synthase [Desulfallas thermosapovorans]TYO93870.1 2-succinyl-5-enolpyruvyl-6-hydroxy-3-cyclohexene-1-carboxylate synthase [Desulfallas thermosapovorans DSM 6562]
MTNYIAALVDELYRLGVREVVISPGSRSTPLAILFCEHEFEVFVNIDERSAGFFALGIAKEKERPVVLVCTSGSAVVHYFPAIVEANYAKVPLIILTADRPHELRQVGAPQTIDQVKIYHGYVKYYEELALPEETDSMYRYVRTVMQKAYVSSVSGEYGVSHINIPLRDPLVPDFGILDFSLGRLEYPFQWTKNDSQLTMNDAVFRDKRGIIICGGDAYANYHREVLALAERLKTPVLADPISNFRNYGHDQIIDSYDAFLKNDEIKKELKPEFIIHFGQVPVSKRLQQFIAIHRDVLYFQVSRTFQYRNPSLSINRLIVASPGDFARSVHVQNDNDEYLSRWWHYQKIMRRRLNLAVNEASLFEGKLVQRLQDMLPEGSRLVVANSMAIRDVDYFWETRRQNIKILCNRGANGIDGVVSTALGISTCQQPTVLLTGDLAFYHDLNGLLVGKTHRLNLVIVVLNNNGGGIFQYLPQSKSKYFKFLFMTPHGMDFAGLQALYDVTYFEPGDYDAFERDFQTALTLEGIKVVNIIIDAELSKSLHDIYTCLN